MLLHIGENDMFAINSCVIYNSYGICKITDIRKEKFFGEEKDYYILKPLNNESSTYYVPVDNGSLPIKMKYILTKEEISELIKVIPDEKTKWIPDDRLRSQKFKELLLLNDRKDLIQLIRTLYTRKQEQVAIGKKLMSVDEGVLAKAEKILFDEFALVLNIQPDEVVPYILQQMQFNNNDF